MTPEAIFAGLAGAVALVAGIEIGLAFLTRAPSELVER